MKDVFQNQNTQLAGLFIISLIILYALSAFQITASWASTPSFILMALAGFFLSYYAINWAAVEEKSEFVSNYLFGFFFLIVGIAGHIIAATFYYQNNIQLSGQSTGPLSALGIAFDYVMKNWWSSLSADPYFMLLLGGILGWVSFLVISKQKH